MKPTVEQRVKIYKKAKQIILKRDIGICTALVQAGAGIVNFENNDLYTLFPEFEKIAGHRSTYGYWWPVQLKSPRIEALDDMIDLAEDRPVKEIRRQMYIAAIDSLDSRRNQYICWALLDECKKREISCYVDEILYKFPELRRIKPFFRNNREGWWSKGVGVRMRKLEKMINLTYKY